MRWRGWVETIPGWMLTGKNLTSKSKNVKITSKGQVTIPEAMRRQYGFLPDTEVSFVSGKEGLVLKKGAPRNPSRSRGEMMVERLAGSGNGKWTTEKLMKLMRG